MVDAELNLPVIGLELGLTGGDRRLGLEMTPLDPAPDPGALRAGLPGADPLAHRRKTIHGLKNLRIGLVDGNARLIERHLRLSRIDWRTRVPRGSARIGRGWRPDFSAHA